MPRPTRVCSATTHRGTMSVQGGAKCSCDGAGSACETEQHVWGSRACVATNETGLLPGASVCVYECKCVHVCICVYLCVCVYMCVSACWVIASCQSGRQASSHARKRICVILPKVTVGRDTQREAQWCWLKATVKEMASLPFAPVTKITLPWMSCVRTTSSTWVRASMRMSIQRARGGYRKLSEKRHLKNMYGTYFRIWSKTTFLVAPSSKVRK